jgi:hypothetical protein
VWPDERVAKFVSENFIAARVHVKDDPADFKRYGEKYGAQWTPTILELDPQGTERHRIEGFLPVEDFLAQLILGLGHMAFKAERWAEAEKNFRQVAEKFPRSDAAAEALYWSGAAKYKNTHDATALRDTAKAFEQRYSDTPWAKKASVWRS